MEIAKLYFQSLLLARHCSKEKNNSMERVFCSAIIFFKKINNLKGLLVRKTEGVKKILKFDYLVLKLSIVRKDNRIIFYFFYMFFHLWHSVIKVCNSQFSISFFNGEEH